MSKQQTTDKVTEATSSDTGIGTVISDSEENDVIESQTPVEFDVNADAYKTATVTSGRVLKGVLTGASLAEDKHIATIQFPEAEYEIPCLLSSDDYNTAVDLLTDAEMIDDFNYDTNGGLTKVIAEAHNNEFEMNNGCVDSTQTEVVNGGELRELMREHGVTRQERRKDNNQRLSRKVRRDVYTSDPPDNINRDQSFMYRNEFDSGEQYDPIVYLSIMTVAFRNTKFNIVTGLHVTKEKGEKNLLRLVEQEKPIKLTENTYNLSSTVHGNNTRRELENGYQITANDTIPGHTSIQTPGNSTILPTSVEKAMLTYGDGIFRATKLLLVVAMAAIAGSVAVDNGEIIRQTIPILTGLFVFMPLYYLRRVENRTRDFTVIRDELVNQTTIEKWSRKTLTNRDTATQQQKSCTEPSTPNERSDSPPTDPENMNDANETIPDSVEDQRNVLSTTLRVEETDTEILISGDIDGEEVAWRDEKSVSGVYSEKTRKFIRNTPIHDNEAHVTVIELTDEEETTTPSTEAVFKSECGGWGIYT